MVARRAQADYYRLLASSPAAETRPVGDGLAVATGIFSNTENGVVSTRLDGDPGEVIAWFQERDAPAMWLDPAPKLARALGRAGCRPDRGGIDMGADLACLDLPAAAVETRVVETPDQLELVFDLMRIGGKLETERDRTAARRIFVSLGLGVGAALCHYLAYADGTAVGMATAFFTAETVLLQHVAVVPTRRRQGIGRALALARLHDARARGCRLAILAPTPESRRLYEPLGFTVTPVRDDVYYLPLERAA